MKWMKFECKYLKNYISANFTFWYLQGGFLGIKNAIYSTYMYVIMFTVQVRQYLCEFLPKIFSSYEVNCKQ